MQFEQFENVENKIERFVDSTIAYLPILIGSIISAFLILIFGLWFIRLVRKLAKKILIRRNLDVSVIGFLDKIINWGLKVMLFIVVISQMGVQTSAFIAVIGAAGLAIGLSLQGSLANFAGGVLILLFKPFRVGDYISSSSGVDGTVRLIDIFNTKLVTSQNQLVIIPNGELSNSNITNYTELGSRRTWFDISVSYSTNLKLAKSVLMRAVENNPYAFKDPAPEVVVTSLNDNSINLSVRVSATNADFWKMHEQLLIECKFALESAGIEVALPQTALFLKK